MKTIDLLKLLSTSSLFLFMACTNPLSEAPSFDQLEGVSQGPLPASIELTQNYPNPFWVVTRIDFRIPVEMHVSIKVYTEEWEERDELVNKIFPAGLHSIRYLAPDLPAGEYYYTMRAGGVIFTRKMKCIK